MNRLYKVFLLVFVSFIFFKCQKDVSYIGSSDPGVSVVINPDSIQSTVQGNVLDENNLPAEGVTITAGTKTAITNASGYFRIIDASLDKNTSLVTAEKPGYFKGYRLFSATSGTNQVVIKLVKRTLAGTITSSAGGSATLPNGARITLPANGIVLASSRSAYSGSVNVYAAYIDPDASDIAQTVPGSFAANDKDGKRVILSSYGMLAVELESAAGEKLQIKTGDVATLTTPISASTLSSAPASIALWYVDEQTGIWKEEGVATKQGNNYVGEVKHFTYWNCDVRGDAASLSFILKNATGVPLVHVSVRVKVADVDSGGVAHGYTDSLGQVKGLVPANKKLLLEVFDPCGNTIYSQNLSPLSQNTDLGVITVTNATTSIIALTGTLLDCNGVPVKNGYAIIYFNNVVRYGATDAAGKFVTAFVTCTGTPATLQIVGVDQTNQQQGASTKIAVTSPTTNTGSITACGTSTVQYINYTLDGIDYSITSVASDSLTGFTNTQGTIKATYLAGNQRPPGKNGLSLNVINASTGTFPVSSLLVQAYNRINLVSPSNITFTNFPARGGEFYEGTLSAKFTDSTTSSTIHTISSTFRVRRNF